MLIAGLALPAGADRAPYGPGRPVPAPGGRTDAELAAKAARIQARMPAHISPEGLLVYVHAVGASPERLSSDALALSDAADWTGCYAAAQACRWSVTHDPEALDEARRLARGLALLSTASGRPGGLVRNAGRPIPGRARAEGSEASPQGQGLWVCGDPSRDQLSGVTLGWIALGHFVDDPEVRTLAHTHLPAIARRLVADGMWLRDIRGAKSPYGELRPDVEWIPFVRNGRLASIGLATVLGGRQLDPAPDLEAALVRLHHDGWARALPSQFGWIRELNDPSNNLMVCQALLSITLTAEGQTLANAREGLDKLRNATVGWWNGGIIACALLGGLRNNRPVMLAELRAVLHAMSEDEVPFAAARERRDPRIPTIVERGNTDWSWKDELGLFRDVPAGATERMASTNTRADWLFAYWLARAAGELAPPPASPPGGPPGAGR